MFYGMARARKGSLRTGLAATCVSCPLLAPYACLACFTRAAMNTPGLGNQADFCFDEAGQVFRLTHYLSFLFILGQV